MRASKKVANTPRKYSSAAIWGKTEEKRRRVKQGTKKRGQKKEKRALSRARTDTPIRYSSKSTPLNQGKE